MYGACLTGRVTKTIRTAAIESCFTIFTESGPDRAAERGAYVHAVPTQQSSGLGRATGHVYPDARRTRSRPPLESVRGRRGGGLLTHRRQARRGAKA
jgi:hypothetical protein